MEQNLNNVDQDLENLIHKMIQSSIDDTLDKDREELV